MLGKKPITRALTITALAALLVGGNARSLRAEKVNMFLGAKMATVTWRPYLIDIGKKYAPWLGWQYIEFGSGLMYGPSVSLLFIDRINLSVSYLYGGFQAYMDRQYLSYNYLKNEIGAINTYLYYTLGKGEIERHDLDAALTFDIYRGFKISAGFKYQPLKMKIKESGAKWDYSLAKGIEPDGGYLRIGFNYRQTNFAPGLGIGYSVSFAEMFSYNITASGIYYQSISRVDFLQEYFHPKSPDWAIPAMSYSDYRFDLIGYGVSGDTSFMAYMKSRILMVLGFRCQYVITDGKMRDSNPFYFKYMYKGMNSRARAYELVFGAYVSVIVRVF